MYTLFNLVSPSLYMAYLLLFFFVCVYTSPQVDQLVRVVRLPHHRTGHIVVYQQVRQLAEDRARPYREVLTPEAGLAPAASHDRSRRAMAAGGGDECSCLN